MAADTYALERLAGEHARMRALVDRMRSERRSPDLVKQIEIAAGLAEGRLKEAERAGI